MFDKLAELETADALHRHAILMDLWQTKKFGFFHGTRYGLDTKYEFNLTTAPLIDEADDFQGEFDFQRFQLLIQTISIAPDTAQAQVRKAAELANAKEWNSFYRKILLKRVTWITASQFNSFLRTLAQTDARAKEFFVVEWMLPKFVPVKTAEFRGNLMIEPYINGPRLNLFLYESGKTECFDDSGQAFDLGLELNEKWPFPFVLDGVLRDKLFYVFDLIPMDHFNAGLCEIPLIERCDTLNQMIGFFQQKAPSIRILEKIEIELPNPKKFNEIRAMYKELGIQYVIGKDPTSVYDRQHTVWKQLKV